MKPKADMRSAQAPEKLYIACNAAEEHLHVVLGGADGVPLYVQDFHAPAQAMRFLAPALEHAFVRLGLTHETLGQRLAGIACVLGPGNFTGLRLSLSTALGLAKVLKLPLAGIDYLPLLAQSCLSLCPPAWSREHRGLWVATHARGGECYLQGFDIAETRSTAVPLDNATVMPLHDLAAAIAAGPRPCLLLGSGPRRYPELEALLPRDVVMLPPLWDHPHPAQLLQAAVGASYGSTAVAPLYLRVSDAEENLSHIARKQGRDPEAMRRDFLRLTSP
jgi:tRNA threonylcarbamoyladenosine biosynthesis protein TsaB